MPRRKRCTGCGTKKSNMTCPRTNPLEKLLDELAAAGYEAHFDEIDAQMARSPLSLCTNCGGAGEFAYTGVKRRDSYRAFWSCELCAHWIEV